jgi:hypothetical protein
MTLVSRAWMLDAVAFHREFDELVHDASPVDGHASVGEVATRVWLGNDPIARTYLDVLRLPPIDESHLADWYRVLMAGYITPTRAFRPPDLLRRRLPDLGWSAVEARRLAHGRELQLLADAYASDLTANVLASHLTLGDKGWLSQDDVAVALERMRGLDPRLFRRHPDLVEVIEQAYEVLEAAATKPDLVLLMLAD